MHRGVVGYWVQLGNAKVFLVKNRDVSEHVGILAGFGTEGRYIYAGLEGDQQYQSKATLRPALPVGGRRSWFTLVVGWQRRS